MNRTNETMQAIVCHQHGDPAVMQYETIPRPQPAEGELLVQTEAIGVNYVDTMRRSGWQRRESASCRGPRHRPLCDTWCVRRIRSGRSPLCRPLS